jgi:hypothetical protein
MLCIGVLALAVTAAATASASETVLRARLAPVAPVTSGSGSFTARATAAAGSTTVRWQLSVTHLTGRATKATITLGGANKLTFVLCKPCSTRASGQLQLVKSIWRELQAHGARIVVETKAHQAGELRGTLAKA